MENEASSSGVRVNKFSPATGEKVERSGIDTGWTGYDPLGDQRRAAGILNVDCGISSGPERSSGETLPSSSDEGKTMRSSSVCSSKYRAGLGFEVGAFFFRFRAASGMVATDFRFDGPGLDGGGVSWGEDGSGDVMGCDLAARAALRAAIADIIIGALLEQGTTSRASINDGEKKIAFVKWVVSLISTARAAEAVQKNNEIAIQVLI